MKARIKVTNEVVDVEPDGTMLIDTSAYISQEGKRFPAFALDFIDEQTKSEDIDWKKFRNDIALKLVDKIPYDAYSSYSNWADAVFYRADCLTKYLMDDIE